MKKITCECGKRVFQGKVFDYMDRWETDEYIPGYIPKGCIRKLHRCKHWQHPKKLTKKEIE